MAEIEVAMVIAWWVAVYHMAVGGYLVFFSERRTPFIIAIGLVKGTLGAAIYLIVRQPLWVDTHAPALPEMILPITLILMLMFSAIATWLIWTAFDLDSPQERLAELFRCLWDWGQRQRRRFEK